MRVKAGQDASFADQFIEIPETELSTLDELIDWGMIADQLQDVPGDYDAVSLFKSLLLQTWHKLSDASLASALKRDIVFMRFCGFSLDGRKPDASTICRFRNRLLAQKKLEVLLDLINRSLESQGLKIANGKYVSADATLITSARRPRKRLPARSDGEDTYSAEEVEYSDDRDASWIKKRGQYTYGYAGYVSTDEDGLVESVSTLPANESESKHFAEVIEAANLPPGKKVLYDKGASSQSNREALRGMGLLDGIMRKKPRGKEMPYWSKQRNKLISQKRFVTERTFGTLKRVYGLSRARYLGVEKVQAEIVLKSMAYNLKRAINLRIRQMDSCAYSG